MKGLAPSAVTRAGLSASRGSPAGALGDLRVTVRASPPGMPPREELAGVTLAVPFPLTRGYELLFLPQFSSPYGEPW